MHFVNGYGLYERGIARLQKFRHSLTDRTHREARFAGERAQELEAKDRKNEFTFIVGTRRCHCRFHVAEFLLARISGMRAADVAANQMMVRVNDPKAAFGDFLSLGRGRLRWTRTICQLSSQFAGSFGTPNSRT
jgi:hypothetical protein